ncbi:DUF4269 domain-containing protein [Flavivirga sp. Y03]|uniref:DUF4269 domain-containing protein n=1 Tax=Flavivirga algicola TaxID=2729136 RepID=A0ABX1RSJ5_9FLAO|nr:DUF4269 domain-containing protein [Flavivirga algicola]
MNDFKNIDYLKSGNSRQKLAYYEINEFKVFEKLKNYNPILTGTIPIEIDLPESDLDIICDCKNHSEFSKTLIEAFGNKSDFCIYSTKINGIKSTISKFKTKNFTFEVFGQNVPSEEQNAYKHMLIENWILKQKGLTFKEEIIKLKSSGIKTEPAFATLLGLKGNPYTELLKFNIKKTK